MLGDHPFVRQRLVCPDHNFADCICTFAPDGDDSKKRMNARLAIAFLFLISASLAFGDEVAVPDVSLLGKQIASLPKNFFFGATNFVFPNHVEFEMSSNRLTSIAATYPRGTSLIDLENALSVQLGPPRKEFTKDSGGKLYEWRDESKHIAALFSEKSERDQSPMITISYLEKKRLRAKIKFQLFTCSKDHTRAS